MPLAICYELIADRFEVPQHLSDELMYLSNFAPVNWHYSFEVTDS